MVINMAHNHNNNLNNNKNKKLISSKIIFMINKWRKKTQKMKNRIIMKMKMMKMMMIQIKDHLKI